MTTLTADSQIAGDATHPSPAQILIDVVNDPLRGLRTATACLSMALHAALLVIAVLAVSHRSGLVSAESSAISIELELTAVAQQLPAEEISDIVQDASVAATPIEGEIAEELKASEVSEPIAASEAQGVEVISGAAPSEEVIGKDTPETPTQPKSFDGRTERKVMPERRSAPTRREIPAEKASVGAKSTAPRASASTGSVLNYASRVRAKVAGNVPRGGGKKGSVTVSFGVSRSGALSYARIARSSGNGAIDGAVLAGVRRSAPFPPPPAGASPSQLRFSVSFHFN